jgi:hypothetical protein
LPYLTANYLERKWVILYTHLNFDEEMGFGIEKSAEAAMSQWTDVRALLIPSDQITDKVKKLKTLDFYGDGVDIPSVGQCWLTEYPWHPSYIAADLSCRRNDTWFGDLHDEGFFLPACELADDSKKILLPAPTLLSQLSDLINDHLSSPKLMPDGSMQIQDSSGQCVVVGSRQSGAVLMIDQTVLMKYLEVQSCGLVWAVLSEKSAWNGSHHVGGLARQGAVYVLESDGKISGSLTIGKNESPETT